MTAPGPGRLAALAGLPWFYKDQLARFRFGWETYGDLYQARFAGWDLWICSGPDQVKEVLVDGRDLWKRIEENRWGRPFGLRLALGDGLLTTDGDAWQWRRKTINPAFHRERVDDMVGTMVEAGEEMSARLAAAADNERPLDLFTEMKRVTQDVISRTMFSADLEHEGGKVGEAVDEALEYVAKRSRSIVDLPAMMPSPARGRFERAMDDIDQAVYRSIARRRSSGVTGDDLLGLLLSAVDGETGEPMTDDQIRNEVATIYGAGHDTTANALTWAWHELMQAPEVLARLQEEAGRVDPADVASLEYTRMVFDETLRYRPPVPVNGRITTEPTHLGRYDVDEGATALLVNTNIHRHPDHWENPESFDPEHFSVEADAGRHRYAYFPFGAGPHMCIGSNFATIEGTLLLALSARHFTLRPAADLPRSQATAVTLKPKGGLPVFVERR